MRATDTQRESWDKLQHEGLSEKRWRVRSAIARRGKAAAFQIANDLGWPFHCVTGKITNLCDAGKVRDTGRTTLNPATNRNVILWEACDEEPRPRRGTCPTCHGSGHVPLTVQRDILDLL